MVLPSAAPASPAEQMRAIDPRWAERLGDEAARFERAERGAALRRLALCLAGAALVVVLGVAGFRFETDTRWALVHRGPPPRSVTVHVVPGPVDAGRRAG